MFDPIINGILFGVLVLIIFVGLYLTLSSSEQSEEDIEDESDPDMLSRRPKNSEYYENDDQ